MKGMMFPFNFSSFASVRNTPKKSNNKAPVHGFVCSFSSWIWRSSENLFSLSKILPLVLRLSKLGKTKERPIQTFSSLSLTEEDSQDYKRAGGWIWVIRFFLSYLNTNSCTEIHFGACFCQHYGLNKQQMKLSCFWSLFTGDNYARKFSCDPPGFAGCSRVDVVMATFCKAKYNQM